MSMYQYESSKLFGKLKQTKEDIEDNWGTEQYLNALDRLLEEAVYPILRSSNFVDSVVAGLLSWHSDASNNKITTYDRSEAVHYMATFLMRRSPDEKRIAFSRIRFDRNITLMIVDSWLKRLSSYRDMTEVGNVKALAYMEKVVLHTSRHSDLYSAIAQVKYWLELALKLRHQILQKYYRMVLTEARHFYEEMRFSVDLDDTIQDLLAEAQKALDKCNQERGTITSYMLRCVHFARSKLRNERDTAYSTPGAARNGDFSYKSVSLDEVEEHVAGDFSFDALFDVEHVRKIARLMDPVGIGRYHLGIEEHTSGLTIRHHQIG